MNPNDFDCEAAWAEVLKCLRRGENAQLRMDALDQGLNLEGQSYGEAIGCPLGEWDDAMRTLQLALSLLRQTGTLDAITTNFPMILGRAG